MKGWSDEKRIQAATADAMGLKAPMVAAATGVPVETIRDWRTREWYKDLVSEIQRDDDRELDGRLSKLIDKSTTVILDRLEKGDFMYDPKTARFMRRPVYMKDATKVTTEIINRRNLLRGKPTSISSKEALGDRLQKLADQFKALTEARNEKVVEGEVIGPVQLEQAA